MLISINWLKDYLGKPNLKIDPKVLAEKLTMQGIAVDDVRSPSMGLENVIVGKIEAIEKHPNADRLQITRIRTSKTDTEENFRQVVCGAKNIAVGDLVPVALPGAVLPGKLTIKESKIRGVESAGMICSGKELELSEDSDGILQLPKHSTLGEPLSRLLGSNDTILELDLTPNRGDCLSVLGVAREACVLFNTKVREPKAPRFRVTTHRTSNVVNVEVESSDICPRYVARVIDNLRVDESPDWIKQRLNSIGIRPINNIVDATNFVMFEFGQPLHAFDLRKIQSGGIRVGRCTQAQPFELLTGETVQLEEGDILILDGDRPIALAGITGGANSQIQPDTTSILLESAVFDPVQIRRTAKRLGIHTDSSKRFEKGVDPVALLNASDRAAALLRDGYDANVYHPPIDTNAEVENDKGRSLSVDMREVRRISGLFELSTENTATHLDSIGITTHRKSPNILSVKFPPYRLDLAEGVDVIEEVTRLVGYDKVPETFPHSESTFHPLDSQRFEYINQAKSILASTGLQETVHYSFTSEHTLRRFEAPMDDSVSLKNPISEEMKVLRTSLVPSLLNTYLFNKNRKATNLRLFEVAKTFHKDSSKETGVREVMRVAGLISGNRAAPEWKKELIPVDFFYLKGMANHLVESLTRLTPKYQSLQTNALFHPAAAANLLLDGKPIGVLGEIHPFIQEQELETKEPVIAFEIDLDALYAMRVKKFEFVAPSKFPSVDFDVAFLVDKSVSHRELTDTMRAAADNYLQEVSIFDIYEGDNIPLGQKSVAFRLTFSSTERTLNDSETRSLRDKVIESVSEKFQAKLRT